MDKGKKLRNYSGKNYNEIISFPVELVGRDGVVRRYSYEDSIRIYRRRIDSAHLRYQDRDVIRAEVNHCSRRMEQIQRSWRERIHSSERSYIEGRPDPAEREPYERGKAFLQSWMVAGHEEVSSEVIHPNLVLLSDVPPCRVFYVNHAGFKPGTLLYVFDLSLVPEGEDDNIDGEGAFEDYLRLLQSCGDAPDVEKLIHEERSADLGFILTNPHPDIRVAEAASSRQGDNPGGELPVTDRSSFMEWLDNMLHEAGVPEDSPLSPVLASMAAGDLERAYHLCVQAVEGSAYNRTAYWIMGALSEILGRWQDTEAYMMMACHYFPADAQSQLLAGLHRLRLGDPIEAIDHLGKARAIKPELPVLHGLLVRAHVAARDLPRAQLALREGLTMYPHDGELRALEQTFVQLEKRRKQILLGSVALTLIAMSITLSWSGVALPVMIGLVLALGGLLAYHRRVERRWFEQLD